jgi:hypothetical protein
MDAHYSMLTQVLWLELGRVCFRQALEWSVVRIHSLGWFEVMISQTINYEYVGNAEVCLIVRVKILQG